MEWQIGQVNVKVKLNLVARKGTITVVAPIIDDQMSLVKIHIDANQVDPIDIETLFYRRGEKDAEKSALE